MQDAWRAYLELATGLTEASRKRAQTAVRRLVDQGGATAQQMQTVVEDLLSTGRANREALTRLVRTEVDRALGAVGLATSDEVAALDHRVGELERQLAVRLPAPLEAEPVSDAPTATVAKRAAARKSAARKATGTAAAGSTAAPDTAAEKTTAKKTTAKKVAAKRLPRPVGKAPGRPVPPTAESEAS